MSWRNTCKVTKFVAVCRAYKNCMAVRTILLSEHNCYLRKATFLVGIIQKFKVYLFQEANQFSDRFR